MRAAIRAVLLFAPCFIGLNAHALGPFVITIDHLTRAQSVDSIMEIAPGEKVIIRILNSDPDCYTYNAEQVVKGNAALEFDGGKPPVVLETVHQRGIGSYKVTIKKRDGAPASCAAVVQKLGDTQTWTISVTTVGWDVGFSGGLVVDHLTDRKYFLQNAGSGQFTVMRDRNSEDRSNQRLGLFVHLVNTEWARHGDWKGGWTPITVGIGFDDKSRYMFGTTYRFGDQWFVTAGSVVGKSAVLPVGVTEGMSTTNQNLLGTLGQKSSTSWFVSVSFGFLGAKAKTGFEGLLEPKPAK